MLSRWYRYGAKSNEQLMLFYGFHIPGNPFDEVPIDVEVIAATCSCPTSPSNTLRRHLSVCAVFSDAVDAPQMMLHQ